MKTLRLIGLFFVTVLVPATQTARADDENERRPIFACPAGQAVQGIDFAKRRLLCVSIVGADLTGLQAQLNQLNGAMGALQAALGAETTARQGADSALQTAIVALQTSNALVLALAPYVSVVQGPLNGVTGPHIVFQGANVHIRSGSGATDDRVLQGGTLTGLGNLVVGYNEPRSENDAANRAGSHNLIVGRQHHYPAFGGFLAGFRNTASGPFASVGGGFDNTASGQFAGISGGQANTASGQAASVSGGKRNTASGVEASVSGGDSNTAAGGDASVSGGAGNLASGEAASVSGGTQRTAAGDFDWAAGGLFQDF